MSDTTIQVKFKSIEDTLSHQDETLKRIEKVTNETNLQAKDTNGKVADITAWKERTIGAMWAFGICLVVVIVPIAGWTLYNQVTEPQRMQDALANYLDQNYSSVKIQNAQETYTGSH